MTGTTASSGKMLNRILALVAFVVMITVSAVVMTQKESFFLDEFSSFSCSNSDHGKRIPLEQGLVYEDPYAHWMETLGAAEGSTFSYGQIWENMSENCHPPFYYVFLHFVSSLFPRSVNKWYGYAVNLLFALINLVFFRRITRKLTGNELITNLISVAFAGVLGLTANIVLIRMYTMGMCSLTVVSWELLCYFYGDTSVRRKVWIVLTSIVCALTHYYCIPYLVFACAVLCILLLIKKRWKDVLWMCGLEAVAAGSAIAIFPAMLTRMFSAGRGEEAVSNMTGGSSQHFAEHLRVFLGGMNRDMFAFRLHYLVIAGVLGLLVYLFLKKKKPACVRECPEQLSAKDFWQGLSIVLVPAVLFWVLVSKVVYAAADMRYMYLIYSVVFLSGMCGFYRVMSRLIPRRGLAVLMAALCVYIPAYSWQVGSVNYLYRGSVESREEMIERAGTRDLVVLWYGPKHYESLLAKYLPYMDTAVFYTHIDTDPDCTVDALEQGRHVMALIYKNDAANVKKWLESRYPSYRITPLGASDDATYQAYDLSPSAD